MYRISHLRQLTDSKYIWETHVLHTEYIRLEIGDKLSMGFSSVPLYVHILHKALFLNRRFWRRFRLIFYSKFLYTIYVPILNWDVVSNVAPNLQSHLISWTYNVCISRYT